MGYLLYSLSFLVLVTGTLLFLTRARWIPAFQDAFHSLTQHLPGGEYLYSRLAPGSFEDDIEAGLSSSTFDLTGNVEGGDGRAGLDDAAKREVLRIMKKRRLKFDEARRVYMEQRFQENGIGADGRPRDPKFVSFS
ncbi:hypothetical protein B0J18DRAFT_181225 [Chaetomium sp. MPI-SDFR-AT-0129]|uniref:Uncharacterized protein n=1 Tax=Dichotomopilus funicola TaxID=1934379 RepID=A0AAN6V7Q5_9PEZI|nr:hypothetical protein B0J18DRAFT_181225 [Chaetomium sp. MPI-SDFR-AT-0129]KAK4146357.1 hypothetical protein C8A04DRAFT_9934 [Dichotomopilus funicola]